MTKAAGLLERQDRASHRQVLPLADGGLGGLGLNECEAEVTNC